jgi:hypothetical protein
MPERLASFVFDVCFGSLREEEFHHLHIVSLAANVDEGLFVRAS